MFHKPAHKDVDHPAGQVHPGRDSGEESHPDASVQAIEYTPRLERSLPNISKLIAFEQGDLDEDEVVALFQDGIDRGWVWHLQGFYGRTASMLIEQGLCSAPARGH